MINDSCTTTSIKWLDILSMMEEVLMTALNSTIEAQLNHRTIRQFKDEEIPNEIFTTLMEVARQTATSMGMQAFSIIRVTDRKVKEEIAKVCKQDYVAEAPELLIFLVDQFRNAQIAKEKGGDATNASNMDFFFQGFTDATIAAQNVVNAAESLELGTVYLGSILNDSEKICELLKLPKLTFPAVGLGIGYPNQNPDLKPRMDNRFKIFENEYTIFDQYVEQLKDYDEEMSNYYDLRNANQRVDSFTNQVVQKLKNSLPKRRDILKVIAKQGFDVN